MSSDGPKSSQGYIRNPADAGMTNRPEFLQLLDYTDGEVTWEIANSFLRKEPKEKIEAVFFDFFRCPARLSPVLRREIDRRIRRLRRTAEMDWCYSDRKIAEAHDAALNHWRTERGL